MAAFEKSMTFVEQVESAESSKHMRRDSLQRSKPSRNLLREPSLDGSRKAEGTVDHLARMLAGKNVEKRKQERKERKEKKEQRASAGSEGEESDFEWEQPPAMSEFWDKAQSSKSEKANPSDAGWETPEKKKSKAKPNRTTEAPAESSSDEDGSPYVRFNRNAPGCMAALASSGVSREFGGFDSPKQLAPKPRRALPARHEPQLGPLRVPASRAVVEEEEARGRSQASGASSAMSVHLEHLTFDEVLDGEAPSLMRS
ncbi:hypothetical protein T484DRAFT_1923850 [Baffinella frigidus]|nr:hypothetical protein T484DRAFT_1923850 [Cryptophyta sp. CCMP2293]